MTKQEDIWNSKFGKDYTDRNIRTTKQLDEFYNSLYGLTRTELNESVLYNIKKDAKILEVGCSDGTQLQLLKEMGFTNLYGVELQEYAVQCANKRLKGIEIKQGSIFDIPYDDKSFDVVFTSGLLIHISPENIDKAMSEMNRCTSDYIWGFEYYSEKYKSVKYRNSEDVLWKADFSKMLLDKYPQYVLKHKKKVLQLNNDYCSIMYLLRKGK